MRAVNQGTNPFCGPAVISILTGKNTDDVAREFNKLRNNMGEIREVHVPEIIKVCDKFGFDCIKVNSAQDSSLYWTLHLIHNIEGMYILVVPKHVVAIEVKAGKVYFCDNHTKEPINAAHSARLGQKVIEVYQVIKRPTPKTFTHTVTIKQVTYTIYKLNGMLNKDAFTNPVDVLCWDDKDRTGLSSSSKIENYEVEVSADE